MEDRFIYRAKPLNGKDWVYGYLAAWDEGEKSFVLIKNRTELPIHINPFTICQSTGVRDAAGKLIFENDYIEMEPCFYQGCIFPGIKTVEWLDGSWGLIEKNGRRALLSREVGKHGRVCGDAMEQNKEN